MSRRKLVLIIIGVVALAAIGPFVALSADSSEPEQPTPALDDASVAAKKYMDEYVSADGNASEGDVTFVRQARGLLIAAAIADRLHFDAIWQRTQTDLRKPDGSFSASAGDLLVATRAFLVAADRLNDPSYKTTASQLATQILDTHYRPVGQMWGELVENTQQNGDGSLSADTLQFRTVSELATLQSADPRWASVAALNAQVLQYQLTKKDGKLPADVVAVSAPTPELLITTADDANYGASAQTIPIALKESCKPADATSAKKLWLTLRDSPTVRVAKTLTTTGKVVDGSPTVQATIATAATAQVAGEHVQSQQLLDQADAIAKAQKTVDAYAWAAIGRITISTDWLGTCK